MLQSTQCKPCPNPRKACWCQLSPDIPASPTVVKAIVKDACRKHGIGIKDIRARCRRKDIVQARTYAMCQLRELTNYTLTEIGNEFNVSHSTVLHALKKTKENNANKTDDTKPA